MGPDSDIHVLNSGPLKPTSGILQSLDAPDASCPIESEEVQENPVHLLLNLKVEAQIYVLEPCQEVLFFVDKDPSGLYQPHLWIVLHTDTNGSFS